MRFIDDDLKPINIFFHLYIKTHDIYLPLINIKTCDTYLSSLRQKKILTYYFKQKNTDIFKNSRCIARVNTLVYIQRQLRLN